jgi:hypothetical protein
MLIAFTEEQIELLRGNWEVICHLSKIDSDRSALLKNKHSGVCYLLAIFK